MYFDSVAAALDMAGHGGYVWTVYGVTVLAVMVLLVGPVLRKRRFQQQQRTLLLSEIARQQRAQQRGTQTMSEGDVSAPGT
jgi:heme exporter protein D